MLFLGPELPIGTMASFSVRMAGIGTIEVLGEVRRHSETSEGIALGIRFVPLSSANLALLREFMALPF